MPNHDHDQPNQCGVRWNTTQSTSTTVSLKKMDSPEDCTTSDEYDDVFSSDSGEIYEPSSSDKPSSSDLSPPSSISLQYQQCREPAKRGTTRRMISDCEGKKRE